MNYPNNEDGFSLIECVIAIAILATVVGSMISMQGSVLKIVQFSSDKTKATIELHSMMAQFEYVLNTKGQAALPKPEEPKRWTALSNHKFTDVITIANSDIKLSSFLLSALGIYYMNSEKNEFEALKPTFKIYGDMLDGQLTLQNQTFSINVDASIIWALGKQTKNISEKIYLLNNESVNNLKLPSF